MKMVIGFLALSLGAFLVWQFVASPAPRAEEERSTSRIHSVVLTKDGYVPKEVHIAVGDTVAFSSTLTEKHWPASNLHPTHALYAEFDPKKPLAPTETWSFVFTRPGEWRFHDHLAPYYTGSIIVE